ncbi:MAG: type II toxin-antitoxin system VapC family toxin [Candidatus Bathyarchaeia archaeon]
MNKTILVNGVNFQKTLRRTIPIEEEDIKPFEKYLLKYDLKPSDTIHLATMEKAGVNHIVTEDEDFDRVGEAREFGSTPSKHGDKLRENVNLLDTQKTLITLPFTNY